MALYSQYLGERGPCRSRHHHCRYIQQGFRTTERSKSACYVVRRLHRCASMYCIFRAQLPQIPNRHWHWTSQGLQKTKTCHDLLSEGFESLGARRAPPVSGKMSTVSGVFDELLSFETRYLRPPFSVSLVSTLDTLFCIIFLFPIAGVVACSVVMMVYVARSRVEILLLFLPFGHLHCNHFNRGNELPRSRLCSE
jgi:hypothetical protein